MTRVLKFLRAVPASVKYLFFRVLAFAAAVGFPAAAALEQFEFGHRVEEQYVVEYVKPDYVIGLGGILILSIAALVFYKQVIETIRRHVGMTMVVIPAVAWAVLTLLERCADIIPGLKIVAFWWTIGGLAAWGLTTVGVLVSGIDLSVKAEARHG